MSNIFKTKKQTKESKYTLDLLRSAEQRINFIYLMLMIAFESAILLYVLLNDWDDARYYFGIRAGIALLPGIIINIIFRKKSYPWIKYVNNLLIIIALFFLCGFNDSSALLFILLPFINSFYLRPRFTIISGIVCVFMMYICFMSIAENMYGEDGQIIYNFFTITRTAFDFTNEAVITILQNRSFLIITAVALVVVSVYLSFNSRSFTIKQGELMNKNLSTEAELNVAQNIQMGILSKDFPDNESYGVYADMTTATEVGGDFYDYFLVDETHLAIVIGDVSGHGMPAAMFMTLAKTLIKVYAQAHYFSDKVFEHTNRYLQQSNPEKFFVTSWLGIIDLTTGVLSFSNAGHNYPVIIRKDGKTEFLNEKPNFVLGRKRLVRYMENRTKLNPGDKLVLYTDGVTEAQTADEKFFGDDRLLEVIGANKEQNQKDLVISVRKAVDEFENGEAHHDDVTILALSYKDHLQVTPPDSKTFFLTKETFDSVTDYICERCSEAGCGEQDVSKVSIATSEILANIESYAYENGGELEILTKCRDRRMTIVFKDNGKAFNPLLVQEPDITLPLSERTPGGLGIFIVKKLMSDTSYAYIGGHNVLTLEMDF